MIQEDKEKSEIGSCLLALLLCFSFFLSPKYFGFEVPGFTLFLDRILVASIFPVLFFTKRVSKRTFRKVIWVFSPWLIYLALHFLFLLYLGGDTGQALQVFKQTILFSEIVFFTVTVLTIGQAKITFFLNIMMVLTIVIGIFQGLGLISVELQFLAFLPKTEEQMRFFLPTWRGVLTRTSSFFTNPLSYSAILSVYILFIIYQVTSEKLRRSFFVILFILSNVALVLTGSRSPYFGLIIIYSILLIKKGFGKSLVISISILFVVFFLLLLLMLFIEPLSHALTDRFFPEGFRGDVSLNIRFYDYSRVIESYKDKPFFGAGFGAYGVPIDSYFLTVLFDYGLLGFMFLSLFFFRTGLLFLTNLSIEKAAIFFQVVLLNLFFDAFGFAEFVKFFFIILAIVCYVDLRQDRRPVFLASNRCKNRLE